MIIRQLNWLGIQSVLYALFVIWLLAELFFFILFHAILIPFANRHVSEANSSMNQSLQNKKSNPYREPYHIHKHLLLRRILQRILMDSNAFIDTYPMLIEPEVLRCDPVIVQNVITEFITSWFHPLPSGFSRSSSVTSSVLPSRVRLVKGYSTISSSSRESTNSSSSNCSSNSEDSDSGIEENSKKVAGQWTNRSQRSVQSESILRDWTIPNIRKKEMDEFLAWSMFNKHMQQMNAADLDALQKCYQELQSVVGLTFCEAEDEPTLEPRYASSSLDKQDAARLVPRRLSLEYAKAWHRPLLAYVFVYFLRTVLTRLILQYGFGFVRVRSKSVPQLTGWYRPSKLSVEQSRMPIVFFHGIAPAGVLLYLPMLLLGSQIVSNDRCCLLIDHYNISCTLQFDALSEMETVVGVKELINAYFPNPSSTPIAVCGHSFGSCCISWLMNHCSKLRQQIQLCILLDPVSILLSDPHVMTKFLYSRKVLSCVRMVASSELFTEYYLRHHFSWYNSELWLDEILLETNSGQQSQHSFVPRKNPLHVLVALSEKDEIVNAPKVKRHIDLFVQRHFPYASYVIKVVVESIADCVLERGTARFLCDRSKKMA